MILLDNTRSEASSNTHGHLGRGSRSSSSRLPKGHLPSSVHILPRKAVHHPGTPCTAAPPLRHETSTPSQIGSRPAFTNVVSHFLGSLQTSNSPPPSLPCPPAPSSGLSSRKNTGVVLPKRTGPGLEHDVHTVVRPTPVTSAEGQTMQTTSSFMPPSLP